MPTTEVLTESWKSELVGHPGTKVNCMCKGLGQQGARSSTRAEGTVGLWTGQSMGRDRKICLQEAFEYQGTQCSISWLHGEIRVYVWRSATGSEGHRYEKFTVLRIGEMTERH